jgi:fructuronate reductase
VLLPDGPDLASAGATLTGDVGAWEKAKLRILNGAHSTLAYLGLLVGHETVADAMNDDVLRGFVERLIADNIIPTLRPSSMDLTAYAQQTLRRFRNPAIHHRLSQIAWDGSQKLPYRLLDTVADALGAERPIDRLAMPVAAWIMFLERRFRAGEKVVDPLVDRLRALALSEEPVRAVLELRQIFPETLGPDSRFGLAVARAREAMLSGGVRPSLAQVTAK